MKKSLNNSKYDFHTLICLFLFPFFLVGCINLVPVSMDSATVQEEIRSGNMISVGGRVKITTEDGVSHILTVTDLNEQAITGDLERTVTPDAWTDGKEQKPAEGSDIEATSIEIQIDQIREVAEEEHDAVKTGVLAGGLAAFAYLLFLAAAIAASAATLSGGF